MQEKKKEKKRKKIGVSNVIDILEHHRALEVGLLSLQVVHFSIWDSGVHFQGCTAIGKSQLFRQPRKVGAQWRDIPPEFVLVLPRLTIAKVRGKSYQDTLVVDNFTPEVYKHSISFTQPHLNPLLIVRGSSLHLERLCGTIR